MYVHEFGIEGRGCKLRGETVHSSYFPCFRAANLYYFFTGGLIFRGNVTEHVVVSRG